MLRLLRLVHGLLWLLRHDLRFDLLVLQRSLSLRRFRSRRALPRLCLILLLQLLRGTPRGFALLLEFLLRLLLLVFRQFFRRALCFDLLRAFGAFCLSLRPALGGRSLRIGRRDVHGRRDLQIFWREWDCGTAARHWRLLDWPRGWRRTITRSGKNRAQRMAGSSSIDRASS